MSKTWGKSKVYVILNDDHANSLDRNTAINRFDRGMSLEEAESQAYNHYKKEQHLEAAIHHLAHMRASQAVGDIISADKHAKCYAKHVGAAGMNPNGPVPSEIGGKVGKTRLYEYEFKPHGMDSFVETEK
jgi:hypothetical protein